LPFKRKNYGAALNKALEDREAMEEIVKGPETRGSQIGTCCP